MCIINKYGIVLYCIVLTGKIRTTTYIKSLADISMSYSVYVRNWNMGTPMQSFRSKPTLLLSRHFNSPPIDLTYDKENYHDMPVHLSSINHLWGLTISTESNGMQEERYGIFSLSVMVGGRNQRCAERSCCLLISRPAEDGRGSITVRHFSLSW